MRYNYKCKKCNSEIELDRKIENRNKPVKCRKCKRRTMVRQLNPVPIIYNTGGFYSKDNKK